MLRIAVVLGLLASAAILRHGLMGDPIAGFDEQFYLLVGDRLWHGMLPYVDIWDRKPLGLFLIYAFARLLGGDGIWQAQVLATLFAGATALIIAQMVMQAREGARNCFAGFASGALYLLFLNVFGGAVGQAPVFYNLLMAGAAWSVRSVALQSADRGRTLKIAVAMGMCGLALTVKTTVIFESLWFGLFALGTLWRARLPVERLAGLALLMMILGAAPFIACGIPYYLLGHFDAFWFANAQSAMLRPRTFTWWDRLHLIRTVVLMLPLIVIAILGRQTRQLDESSVERRFLFGWIFASAIGALSVGIFYEHYAMNMLVPLSVACGACLRSRRGPLAFSAAALGPLHLALVALPATAAENLASWNRLSTAVTSAVEDQCMLVYDGPAILYHTSQACLVTSHPFLGHFWSETEAAALGVDQRDELTRALRRRPAVVVTGLLKHNPGRNAWADKMVQDTMKRDYVRRRSVDIQMFDAPEPIIIWERRDLAFHRKL